MVAAATAATAAAGGAAASPPPTSSTIARFQRVVLGWDYLRLLRESTNPPKNATAGLKTPANTFPDVAAYLAAFEPLLFEEIKAQIVQGRDEDSADWQRGVVETCAELDGFHKVTVVVHDEFQGQLSENDLLLLSKEMFREGAVPSTYAFAMVEHRGGRTVTLRVFFEGEVKRLDKFKAEPSPRLRKMLAILETHESMLWVLKVCSLSTIIREYVALHSVASLPFKDLILSAAEKSNNCNSEDQAWNVPRPLMDYLKSSLNDSQLDAIHAGLSRRTFVLIQGPPGTGKTQTILGLLSAVLHSSPARVQSRGSLSVSNRGLGLQLQDKFCHWAKASPWLTGVNPRDLIMPVDGDDGFYPTGNELKPEVVSSNRKYRVHVLVCAPSNSALDEIVLRVLHTGIHDENDHIYNPKIVRVGLKPHHSVQAVSLDYLVEQKLASVSSGGGKHGSRGAVDRDRIRASILDEAAVVFSTLSFSGSAVFSNMSRMFDVVIIDEAAQAVEPSTLVPLAHGCKQVFLVGDPVQLPATVISSTAQRFKYDKSLFKRFQDANFPVQMLNTQYRMHPQISTFPSHEFYSGSLENGEFVEKQTTRLWHAYRCFGPFCFFDIDGIESQPSGSGSWVNEDEVAFIVLMYHKLASEYSELKSSSEVAIISPYRHQVKLLRERFRATFGEQSDKVVDINTVDGFQGREKDIAIFSCVRSNDKQQIGFVSDFRRMNVAITRARSSVLVVGSASTLTKKSDSQSREEGDYWGNLVKSAKERNCYFKVPKPHSSFFSDVNLESLRVRDSKYEREQMLKKMDEELAKHEAAGAPNFEEQEEPQDDGMDVDDGGDGGGYDEE